MMMQKVTFQLTTEFIELIRLLKVLRIAESGGQAKMFVNEGEVTVNGLPESRKRAKIRKDNVVRIFDYEIMIQ
jgi:ribosome-associated protein